jgi:hypothetical protein
MAKPMSTLKPHRRPGLKPLLYLSAASVCLAAPVGAQGIEISGGYAFGLVGGSSETRGSAQLYTSLDLSVTATTRLDNGLTIGVTIDLDEALDDSDEDRFRVTGR